jgi:hypothetical protein
MGDIRSDIITTGIERLKAGSIVIDAPAPAIFELLAHPRHHRDIDGSRTVQGNISGPDRLSLGAKFGMSMKIKAPYRITNTVIEFEESKRIAWRHFGRHIWRYELTPIDEAHTLVVEFFDGRPSLSQWWLRRLNAYSNNQKAILKSLVRLKKLAEAARTL